MASLFDAALELFRPVQHDANLLAPQGGRIRDTGGEQAQESPVVEYLRSGLERKLLIPDDDLGVAAGRRHTADAARPGEIEVVAVPRDAIQIARCTHWP